MSSPKLSRDHSFQTDFIASYSAFVVQYRAMRPSIYGIHGRYSNLQSATYTGHSVTGGSNPFLYTTHSK